MSIKTRKSWLAAGLTVLLASGAPGFVAPSMMSSAFAQAQKITGCQGRSGHDRHSQGRCTES